MIEINATTKENITSMTSAELSVTLKSIDKH
jgi:hypothetical protein